MKYNQVEIIVRQYIIPLQWNNPNYQLTQYERGSINELIPLLNKAYQSGRNLSLEKEIIEKIFDKLKETLKSKFYRANFMSDLFFVIEKLQSELLSDNNAIN